MFNEAELKIDDIKLYLQEVGNLCKMNERHIFEQYVMEIFWIQAI